MIRTDNVSAYNYNNNQIWSLQPSEIGLVMWERGVDFDNANRNPKKVHVPSIAGTSLPDPEYAYEYTEGLDKSIYVNDQPCKPAVSSLITIQNYITLYHYDHDYFYHKWLWKLSKMQLESRNCDIDDIHITDKMDNSYCDNCETEHPPCHPLHVCRD